MTRLPLISGRKLIKVLNKVGYESVRQRGSHIRLVCQRREPITVPDYKVIDRSLLLKILRDAELSADDFMALLD